MALEATVTGIDPTTRHIRANLVLTDDGVEVINQDIQVKYSSDTGPTVRTKKALVKKGQFLIDEYKTIQAIKALPAFSTVFGQIQTSLEV